MSNLKWDTRFLSLASTVADWSKDPSTKCGAVIVTPEHRIVSLGFNGLARGVEDTYDRLNDRETKLRMIIHAEINAILFSEGFTDGCTLYTHPFMPCSRCAAQIIQAGITKVVAPSNPSSPREKRWESDFALTREMFSETGITLDLIIANPDDRPSDSSSDSARDHAAHLTQTQKEILLANRRRNKRYSSGDAVSPHPILPGRYEFQHSFYIND